MASVSQARRLGKYFLLFDNLLVVLGFYIVFPLISIRFVEQLGWPGLLVGIALGLRQFTQQGLGIFGGALADRFGAKPLIISGMILRAGGFASMAIADQPWILWLSCLLSALGGTLFDPPRSALIVKLVRPYQRGRFYSIIMAQDSAGAVIGALIGSWLLSYNFQWVCLTSMLFFLLAAAANALILPAYRISIVRKESILNSIRQPLKDKRFVIYVMLLTGYYILNVQIMLMLPLLVSDVAGGPGAVKWMYAIQALLSLCLLYPLARWTERRFTLTQRVMAGLAIMSLSLWPAGLAQSHTMVFTLIFCFYFGIILAEPARETLAASLSNPRARGSYMGFSRLGLALGGGIGYVGGGWLYDLGHAFNKPEYPWYLLGLIGMLTLLGLSHWQKAYLSDSLDYKISNQT